MLEHRPVKCRESGYVLIFVMLALLGIGGVVITGFTQQVKLAAERDRLQHNDHVLAEAKQALLQYAYNYPLFNDEGPGRLPCPDTDNDGENDSDCTVVGRFPWKSAQMNFYDARDASGERLWYAVSNQFFNSGGGPVINSDSLGTITIHDQSGKRMYDGSAAGIAAVIIAPGPEIARNGVLQDRATDENDETQYLDIAAGRDNADFINSDATDGFILGPIEDSTTGEILVNDQIILITAEELIEVAEKATLQTYREALRDYDETIDTDTGIDGDYYPWLYNYKVDDLDNYPADADFALELTENLTSQGRVPSIFSKYFTASNSEPIDTKLRLELNLQIPLSPLTVNFTQDANQDCPENGVTTCSSGILSFDSASDLVFDRLSSDPLTGVTFEDLGVIDGDSIGRLSGNFTSAESIPIVRYFWDEIPTGNGWRECPPVTDTEDDCNRDGLGNFDPFNDNVITTQVLALIITVELNGVEQFDINYGTKEMPSATISVVNAADGLQHANIRASFGSNAIDVNALNVTARYAYDSHYFNIFNISGLTGDIDFGGPLQSSSAALTLRYYPELPRWVKSNRWHDGMLMAYADSYRPGIGGACMVGTDCLQLENSVGVDDNKISLLVYAGKDSWINDGDPLYDDDLESVFDDKNADGNAVFSLADPGDPDENDQALVVCEQVAGVSQCY